MNLQKRPYLIVPKLIEQPTWGGKYIIEIKHWLEKPFLKDSKIGQSYELFSHSKLLVNITDSEDPGFIGEIGIANSDIILNKTLYEKDKDYVDLKEVTNLLDKVLLIKINQASGNSFQLHIKPSQTDNHWKPKPESWYYFEDGLATFGLKKGNDLAEYKNACKLIESKMKELSLQVKNKSISIENARKSAKNFIKKIDPWQYVNLCVVKKGSLVDPSLGGIHHSWEEDKKRYPLGNVLYEIQQDVMDPVSTIRAFDQGKISDDGSVREIHIDDYFKYLDTDPKNNNIKNRMQERKGNRLLTTDNYCLDILEIDTTKTDKTNNSYSHLFIKEGGAVIAADDGQVHLSRGHSCFIPENVEKYIINPCSKNTIILKTFMEF